MMSFVSKTKELCIKNEELCVKNEELHIKTYNFAGRTASTTLLDLSV